MLINLLITFFKIGAFSFGGGYAMLPLIQQEVVINHPWFTQMEFLDILAIAEMTPGPIAINMATFLGFRTAGVVGAIMATIGVILPSFCIVLLIVHFFLKFQENKHIQNALSTIRPTVLGLIASAAILLWKDAIIDYSSIVIAVIAFILVTFKKMNPLFVLLLSGGLGIILYA